MRGAGEMDRPGQGDMWVSAIGCQQGHHREGWKLHEDEYEKL